MATINIINFCDGEQPPEYFQPSSDVVKQALTSYQGFKMNDEVKEQPQHVWEPGKRTVRNIYRKAEQRNLQELTEEHNLQFCHIRNWADIHSYSGDIDPKGGMTVAYRVSDIKGNVVEIATALCSPKDVYDKVIGKAIAASNFAQGEVIRLRLNEAGRWGQQIKEIFAR